MIIFKIFKAKFRDIKIRQKIMAIFLPLIILPLLVLGLVARYMSTKTLTDKTIENTLGSSMLIAKQSDDTLDKAENCADLLAVTLNTVFRQIEESKAPVTAIERRNLIQNQLSFILMGYDVVDSAAFIDKNGEIFSVNMYLRDLYINPSYQPLLNVIAGTSGINVWFPMQKRDILTDNSDAAVLTLGKKVNRIETGNELGTLFLNVKEDRFSSIFENIEKTENKIFLITDENGNIISASDKNLLFTPIDRVIGEWDGRKNPDFDIRNLSDGKRVLLTKISLNKGKWNLVSIIDMEILTKDIREISKIILWIIVICCIIAFGGDALLSNVIATPILKLTRVMARIHEDRYETIVQRHGNDEIGNLVAGFNKMTNKIKELITKIEEEQKQKREYELSLLQSQIKPHFLYNTLDVIYVLSDMGCSREAKTATKALADFYRASLSGGNEIITIRQEIEMVKNYLHIQHFRYKDIFDYKIDVDESIMKYCILKLTIQPLIENAIYHGVKNKPDLGHITIEGSEEKNCIIINVIDDGVGMSEQKLRSILDMQRKKESLLALLVYIIASDCFSERNMDLR